MKTIKERIVEALYRSGKKPVDLSRELGLERGTISEMLKRPGNPPSKYIDATIKLTGYSYEWLTTGSGEIPGSELDSNVPDDFLVQEKTTEYLSGKNIRPVMVTVDRTGTELISYVPVKAQAGYKRGFTDEDFISKLPAFSLPVLINKNKTHRMFAVDGNSMRQLGGGGLNDGDIVIAEYVEDIFLVRDNRVYVIVSTEGVIVKRCINRLQTDDKVLICNSDNKSGEYPAIILHPGEILEVWELKAYLSKQLSFSTDLWQVINDLQVQQELMKDKLKHVDERTRHL